MYYLFALGKIVSQLVPRKVAYFVAWLCAVARFYLCRKDREIMIYNLLAVSKDEKKARKQAKGAVINFAYYLVDFFRYSKLNKRFIDKYVKVDGLEILQRLAADSKGVIILALHLGNYEMGAAVTSILGYPLSVVALPHKDKRVNRLFDGQREMVGLKVIPANVAVKRCFSLLKKGGRVAFLADRDFAGHGLKAKMFFRDAIMPKGPAFFALKTGACIVPSFFVRENKWFYRLKFEEPIFIDSDGVSEESIVDKYVPVLEKYIEKYPDQWYLFEKYWLN